MAGRDSLSELAFEWNRLEPAAPSPMQQFVWACSSAATFASDADFRIATVWDGDRLAAAAPLVMRRRAAAQQIQLLGAAELHEPMDLLAAEPEALDLLAESLVQLGTPLYFQRLPASSPTIAAVRRACRGRAFAVVRPQPACPYLELGASWSEPQRHLHSKRRSDLRRARRRAESMGAVETQILAPRSSELGELLDLALRIEANSWKREAGTALALDNRRASFYRRYAAAASRAGQLRLCYLRIGGEPAAMQMAVQTKSAFWLLKIGYDRRFSRCSPGILLMRDTIAAAATAGLATYEFLGTAEPWTESWTRQVHEQVSLRVYPWQSAGLAALTADTADNLLNRWRRT
jgi:CelD/BcsL family acetyltransferase involved in cellulose biosynthesis